MWILECGTVSVKRKGWISIEMNDGGTSLKQRKKFTREQSNTARFSVLLIYCVLFFSLVPFHPLVLFSHGTGAETGFFRTDIFLKPKPQSISMLIDILL